MGIRQSKGLVGEECRESISYICATFEPMSVPPVTLSIKTRSQSRQEGVSDGSGSSSSSEHPQLAQRTDVELLSPTHDDSQEVEEQEEDVEGQEGVEEEEEETEASETSDEEMPDTRSLVTPGRFRGGIEENVEEYLAQFERIARANGWNDAKKLVIPCYLDGAALKWYENIEIAEGANLNWELLTTRMKGAFQGVAWDEQLDFKLRMRMQGEDEPAESYVQDVINLCSKVEAGMNERSKIKHVLRGLKPSLLEKVMLMANDSLEALLSNIKKVQTIHGWSESRPHNGRHSEGNTSSKSNCSGGAFNKLPTHSGK